jgi:hypothetical protein
VCDQDLSSTAVGKKRKLEEITNHQEIVPSNKVLHLIFTVPQKMIRSYLEKFDIYLLYHSIFQTIEGMLGILKNQLTELIDMLNTVKIWIQVNYYFEE